jgi:hypothetical protein
MPIPPQLWKSEEPSSEEETTIENVAADVVVVRSSHGCETSNVGVVFSNTQGNLSASKSLKRQINTIHTDLKDSDRATRQQEEDTAIRRVGFIFLAYNVEFW